MNATMVDGLVKAIFALGEYSLVLFLLALPALVVVFAWRFGTLTASFLGDRAAEATLRKRRFKRLADDSTPAEVLHKIRTLHPREFEFYVADILAKNGYKSKVVSKYDTPDGGIDIVAKKNGTLYLIQCKKFIDRDVGVAHLREFYGAGADLKHTKGARMIFISTTFFTSAAKSFAKAKKITLIDADYLVSLVFGQEGEGRKIEFNGFDRSEVMRQVPPACPVCTKPLAWRKGAHGEFLGCKNYPQCKYTFSKTAFSNGTHATAPAGEQ